MKNVPDVLEVSKVALIQVVIGLVLVCVSIPFKSIVLFLISIVLLGLGIHGFIKIISGNSE